jgi:hypothetical protein
MSSNKENNKILLETFRIGVTSTTKSFSDLPDTVFCNIIECLDWYDVVRFDTALVNRNARYSYLDALKIRNVKIERNRFWDITLRKGMLDWITIRNARVISWLCVDITKLMTITTVCPQLQSLNIGSCYNITDAGIEALATGCPQLLSLNIGCCYNITDEGIKALATGCPQLQSLNIHGYNITDAGIKALATGCTQSQSLNTGWFGKITDKGIRALANWLPQLQSLNTGWFGKITDKGITALVTGCPQLQSLNISWCDNITTEGIRALANGCPQLQSLDISDCRNITATGRVIAQRINSRKRF